MKILPLSALSLIATTAAGADLTLNLPLDPEAGVTAVRYACADGTEVAVRYVNSGADALALIALPEGARLFVGVIAASGARYVAGPYEWWSRGEEARFSDARAGVDGQICAEQG